MKNKLSALQNLTIFIILISLFSCSKGISPPADSPDILWFNRPAMNWEEATPLGNGRLGAMDFGQVSKQTIQLNEESLWAGEQQSELPENGKMHMEVFRKLILDGDYRKAYDYGMENLTFSPTSFRSYQTLGNLLIDFNLKDSADTYQRVLDMGAGIEITEFEIDGVKYKRQMLISSVDDILLMEISASKRKSLNLKVNIEREKDASIIIQDNSNILMDGQIIDIAAPEGFDDNPGGSGDGGEHMKFASRVYVDSKGGLRKAETDGIHITDADKVTIMFTAATDFNVGILNFDRNIDPLEKTRKIMDSAVAKTASKILVDHIAWHHELFSRVFIDLGSSNVSEICTYDRLGRVIEGAKDPVLDAQYYQFARYLLMCSSTSPGVLPANLQGIWNKHMWAPWEADYHLNINLQMNYWPALSGNLEETFSPLANYLIPHFEKGKMTAEGLYGSDGWIAHHAGSLFGRTTPSGSNKGSQLINGYAFPLGGAWMSLSLYRYFEYTMDTTWLGEKVYPVILGAAEFIEDYLMEHPSGYLVSVPSSSPENNFIDPATGQSQRLTFGATMDNQIITDVLQACIRSSEILNQNKEKIAGWQEIIQALPPTRTGADGTIMEWIEDYEEAEPGHRHMSHLYGLHPSFQITPDKTPELAEAAVNTIKRRLENGGGHTGWSRAWLINFYSRLWMGNEAYEHLQLLFRKSTKPNLFDNHPPFQIDGNFGGAAGIIEMLVQSQPDALYLLPALPDAWPKGKLSGIKARGDITIDMSWDNGNLTEATLTSPNSQDISLVINGKKSDIHILANKAFHVNPNSRKLP